MILAVFLVKSNPSKSITWLSGPSVVLVPNVK